MNEEISYGVFWKWDGNEQFVLFSGWSVTYQGAYNAFKIALANPLCTEAKIVERTESFENVIVKRGEHN